MTATAGLLPALEARGIEVWVEGSRLRFRAPQGAMTPELREALRADRDTVIETLRRRATSTVTTAPLSYSQRALWFLAQQAPDTSAYNLSFSARIHSAIDVAALRRALLALVDRHAMLRTTYVAVNGEPQQRTAGAAEPVFTQVDASSWNATDLYDRVCADSRVSFDLAAGPVFRATLFTQASDEHVFLLGAHHIALDGWSLLVLINELKDAYTLEAGLGNPTLPRVESHYVDFAREQLDRLGGAAGERAWEFWRTMLEGARTVLELPTDRPRPRVLRFAGAAVNVDVDATTTDGLRALARAHGTTLYVVLLAAYDVLLYQYTGQDDLIVGTPAFGRTRPEYSAIVGDFIDTTPLRARIDPAAPFTTLLQSVRANVLQVLTQDAYPLPLLVERMQLTRDMSRTPLIQTTFALQKFEQFRELQDLLMPGTTPTRTKLGALECSPFPIPQGEGQFDVSLQLGEKDGTLHGALLYDVDLYDAGTVQRMADLYVALLGEIAAHPETVVGALPSVSPAERARLLAAGSGGAARSTKNTTFTATHVQHARSAVPASLLSLTESTVASIWTAVLRVPEIGGDDDFFDLGGHSLLATQVMSRIRAAFQVQLPVATLFDHSTLRDFAAHVEGAMKSGAKLSLPPLQSQAADGPAPLSFSQERMWIVQELDRGNSAYNVPFALRLRGRLVPAALDAALRGVVARHETLRSTYRFEGDRVVQEVNDAPPEPLEVVDVSRFGHMAAAEARGRAQDVARASFDLVRGPVLRHVLYRIDAEEHLLLFCAHHIAADAWALAIITEELRELYNSEVQGTPAKLAATPIRYRDYARWQRRFFTDDVLKPQLEFWRNRLAGVAPINLPTDRPHPPFASFEGARHIEPLAPELLERLRAFAAREGVTEFSVVGAAFAILLRKWSGQDDFAIAVPVAHRIAVEMENLVGTFVNTLPVRVNCAGDPSVRELLQRVHRMTLEALAHQDLPFERLVQDPALVSGGSRAPIAQVMLNMYNMPLRLPNFANLNVDVEMPDRGATQFELAVSLDLQVSRQVYIEYSTALFDADTVARLARQFVHILGVICTATDVNIGVVDVLPSNERDLLLQVWNATDAEYPEETVTSRLIETQVARTPMAVAVTADDDSVSYAELDARANRIARHLLRAGARRGTIVGICMQRTPDLVAAMLGVQKSGATYLPIDPYFPAERVNYMLADSGAALLITDPVARERLEVPSSVVVVDVVRDAAMIAEYAPDGLADAPAPADAAYVIYTSGSTGRPKGVVVQHGALVNFLWSMKREPGITSNDVLAAVTTVSFDISALEIYLPLLVGARIVLVSRDVAADGERLTELLDSAGATMLQATPSTWRLLLESGWQGSKNFRALTGGEGLPSEVAEALHSRVGELWNLYGPTETTIWSTAARIDPGSRITIGRPIANTRVYVLDADRKVTPIGVPGELWIGGVGVAQGYHGRQELTEERFVLDPFAGNGSRMYRTGDRARWLADGTLEHLGRLDNQVKIRGFRIELGEIEAALAAFPGVRHAVVAPRSAGSGDVRLVAYVAYETGQDASASDMRRALRRELPDYMVPSLFVSLNELPLTPNGKVDREALPDPFRDAQPDRGGQVKMPPAPGLETVMADIWRTMLQVDDVGAEDNFFELGGHSLLALRVAATVHAQTGWRMDPRVLFFQHLRQIVASAPASARSPLLRPELAPA